GAKPIPPLEAFLKSDDLSIEMIPEIKGQIERLQKPQATKDKEHTDNENRDEDRDAPDSSANQASVTQRLDQLDRSPSFVGTKQLGHRIPHGDGVEDRNQGSAIKIRRSRKLFPVGPVMTA